MQFARDLNGPGRQGQRYAVAHALVCAATASVIKLKHMRQRYFPRPSIIIFNV